MNSSPIKYTLLGIFIGIFVVGVLFGVFLLGKSSQSSVDARLQAAVTTPAAAATSSNANSASTTDIKSADVSSSSIPVPPKLSNAEVAQKQQENKSQLAQASQILSNKNIIAKVKPSVVYIENSDGSSGSGFIISTDGYIMTNAHVVTGFDTTNITLSSGAEYVGNIVGRNEKVDVAIVKIDATNLQPASLGNSDQVQQGDDVFAFGYPFGISGDVDFKNGTVSRWQMIDGTNYIEISAQIEHGNSGGPLVNNQGKVVGINEFLIDPNSVSGIELGESLKFAMPINTAKALISALENGEDIRLPTAQQTNNASCQATYGQYSQWSGQTGSNGSPTCICQTGYSWDGTGNSCALNSTLQQQCVSEFGTGSYSLTQGGKAVCDCRIGYVWNSAQTQCVYQYSSSPSYTPPPTPTPVDDTQFPYGSTITIPLSLTMQIGNNPHQTCDQLGVTANELTLCNLYRNYHDNYSWNIDQSQ